MVPAGLGQFEGIGHDPVATLPREDRLLNRHFEIRALVETAANCGVFAFVVLTDDTEINLNSFSITERRPNSFQQPYRPQIHVLFECPADGNKQAPKGGMVGYARITHRSKKDCIERAQLLQYVLWHHAPCLEIGLTTPVEVLP